MGEYCGWNTKPYPEVDELFRRRAKDRQPNLAELIDATKTHCGLRPFANDGIMIVGRLPGLANALINVGPGFNGWKISGGAGEMVARIIDGGDGSVDEGNEAGLAAVSPAGRVKAAPIWSRMCIYRWH